MESINFWYVFAFALAGYIWLGYLGVDGSDD